MGENCWLPRWQVPADVLMRLLRFVGCSPVVLSLAYPAYHGTSETQAQLVD